MNIRQVDGSKQLARLVILHRRTFPLDDLPSIEDAFWWIAEDGGVPVAFAGSRPSAQWGDAMYLCRCGVLPSHRGRGLQQRLIRAREAFAAKADMRWLITDTNGNTPSANNLIASGFRLYEPRCPWAANGALYWKKQLDPASGVPMSLRKKRRA